MESLIPQTSLRQPGRSPKSSLALSMQARLVDIVLNDKKTSPPAGSLSRCVQFKIKMSQYG